MTIDTFLNTGLSGIIGAVFALYVNHLLQGKQEQEKLEKEIQQELRAHATFQLQLMRRMCYALIQFEFYRQRDLNYQQSLVVAEQQFSLLSSLASPAQRQQVTDQLRRAQQRVSDNDLQATFWRGEAHRAEDAVITAIRDLHRDLIKTTQLFRKNRTIVALCDQLLSQNPVSPDRISSQMTTMSGLEEWEDNEVKRTSDEIIKLWVTPIVKLCELVERETHPNEVSNLGYPELPVVSFLKWIRKKLRQ